jgi:biotin transport system substrate-specific component
MRFFAQEDRAMLSTISSRVQASQVVRLAGIVLFAAFTALTARVTIPLPFTPVPITLQVMVVLLAGLVLGSEAGAVSQLAYLAAIAAGLPLDARGTGSMALFCPTAGYLVGFAPAAFACGWIAERLSDTRASRFFAALVGLGVIYVAGLAWLATMVGGLRTAWALGVAPFIVIDLGKAVIAAAVAESGRLLFDNKGYQP